MKPSKLSKAFTLVEILIAVAIMTIITGVALVGVNVNRNRQTLITGAETVKAALQQVQTYAKNPRSQDFRPLYYLVRFEVDNGIFFIITRVYTDENNDGWWDSTESKDISQTRLTPVRISTGVSINGFDVTMSLNGVEIGYQAGDPQQIMILVNDPYPPDIVHEPGEVNNADLKFVFSDPENPNLDEAYEALPGRSYPHLLITNGGAKIEIDMQDS